MLAELDHNDLILTANRRLANDLQHRFDQLQISSGKNAWRAPQFMPLNAWLSATFSVLTQLPDTVTQLIWQQIIDQSDVGGLLICSQQAAKQAYDAWSLSVEWQVADQVFNDYDHDGLAQFRQWRDTYCQTLYQLKAGDRQTVLTSALLDEHPCLPKRIHLVGFEHFSPTVEGIIDKLKLKSTVLVWHETRDPAPLQAMAYQDQEAELQSMVNWAIANQHQSIACIVPDINNLHARLNELFEERQTQANIAAAIALSNYALIAAGQLLLQAVYAQCDHTELSSLERSPFVTQVPQAQLLKSQTPRRWAKLFSQTLQESGWPGTRTLNSTEHQAKDRLLKAFEEFAHLEIAFGQLSQSKALEYWQSVLANIAFQPQGEQSPIQVLGLLEAAGLQFDAIWLQGMTDEVLPAPLAGNTFLPMRLQRELRMPRANPEHELSYARNMIDRLRRSCGKMIVSYPKFDGDRLLAISPLFANFPVIHEALAQIDTHQNIHLQPLEDQRAPPVKPDEAIRGGSYILKAQATCPFKAFAEIRLHAKPVPEPFPGIDPAERGTWVHEILQSIWTQLRTHADLLAADIPSLVDHHIEISGRNLPDEPSYDIERQRLKKVIVKWLNYECGRPPFSVAAVEAAQSINIGGLEISMRLDRMDTLADNSTAIIDYKTGKASINDWFGERPLEPQLPLYCLANDQVTHLSFAQVRSNDLGFSGVCDGVGLLPDTKSVAKFADDWPSLTAHWRDVLTRIAEEFLQGDARVDPKNGKSTCQYCHCLPICRIFEYDNR